MIRKEDLYQKSLGLLASNRIKDLKEAREILEGITDYKDCGSLLTESEETIRKLESEEIASRKKRKRISLVSACVLSIVLIAVSIVSAQGNNKKAL